MGDKKMETIKDPVSVWKGSTRTAGMIAHEIAARWGEEEVKKYDPDLNCFTFRGWQERGYRVKKGEKALRSFTFIPGLEETKKEDGTTKHTARGYLKGVCLFYILQVEKRA
jgi:hypothetical protein